MISWPILETNATDRERGMESIAGIRASAIGMARKKETGPWDGTQISQGVVMQTPFRVFCRFAIVSALAPIAAAFGQFNNAHVLLPFPPSRLPLPDN